MKLNLFCRLADSVKILMALGIFFSYPIQFYVCFEIIWQMLADKLPDNRFIDFEYFSRFLLVLFTCKYCRFLHVQVMQQLSFSLDGSDDTEHRIVHLISWCCQQFCPVLHYSSNHSYHYILARNGNIEMDAI